MGMGVNPVPKFAPPSPPPRMGEARTGGGRGEREQRIDASLLKVLEGGGTKTFYSYEGEVLLKKGYLPNMRLCKQTKRFERNLTLESVESLDGFYALEKVDWSITIKQEGNKDKQTLELPNLKEIGGSLKVSGNVIVHAPKLKKVGSNLLLEDGASITGTEVKDLSVGGEVWVDSVPVQGDAEITEDQMEMALQEMESRFGLNVATAMISLSQQEAITPLDSKLSHYHVSAVSSTITQLYRGAMKGVLPNTYLLFEYASMAVSKPTEDLKGNKKELSDWLWQVLAHLKSLEGEAYEDGEATVAASFVIGYVFQHRIQQVVEDNSIDFLLEVVKKSPEVSEGRWHQELFISIEEAAKRTPSNVMRALYSHLQRQSETVGSKSLKIGYKSVDLYEKIRARLLKVAYRALMAESAQSPSLVGLGKAYLGSAVGGSTGIELPSTQGFTGVGSEPLPYVGFTGVESLESPRETEESGSKETPKHTPTWGEQIRVLRDKKDFIELVGYSFRQAPNWKVGLVLRYLYRHGGAPRRKISDILSEIGTSRAEVLFKSFPSLAGLAIKKGYSYDIEKHRNYILKKGVAEEIKAMEDTVALTIPDTQECFSEEIRFFPLHDIAEDDVLSPLQEWVPTGSITLRGGRETPLKGVLRPGSED
jgi:hypothetical protein